MTDATPLSAVGQPEWRAALLADAIRHTAPLAGPVCAYPELSGTAPAAPA